MDSKTNGISYVGELKLGGGIDAHVENCFTMLCANTMAGIPCTCEQKQDFIETIADFQ